MNLNSDDLKHFELYYVNRNGKNVHYRVEMTKLECCVYDIHNSVNLMLPSIDFLLLCSVL